VAARLDFAAPAKLVSAACGSTGWEAAVLGIHPWHLAVFDPRAQEEIWGEDPEARAAASR
jgi:3-hydroxy-9,10-secoandrosta-1,3,5(10)-triene-9,17-dione monooxygenase